MLFNFVWSLDPYRLKLSISSFFYSHENYGTQLANDRAKFLDQMALRAESPTPVTSTFDPSVLTELPELIVEPVICSDPIRAFIQDTSEWPSDRPDNLWSDIDDFIVNGIMSRKRSGSSSSQKKNKEKLKNTCTKQERKRKNGHPHHFSSMTRQGFVDFDFWKWLNLGRLFLYLKNQSIAMKIQSEFYSTIWKRLNLNFHAQNISKYFHYNLCKYQVSQQVLDSEKTRFFIHSHFQAIYEEVVDR